MEARVHTDGKGRKSVDDACTTPCAIERGMRILGGKWTGSILWTRTGCAPDWRPCPWSAPSGTTAP